MTPEKMGCNRTLSPVRNVELRRASCRSIVDASASFRLTRVTTAIADVMRTYVPTKTLTSVNPHIFSLRINVPNGT